MSPRLISTHHPRRAHRPIRVHQAVVVVNSPSSQQLRERVTRPWLEGSPYCGDFRHANTSLLTPQSTNPIAKPVAAIQSALASVVMASRMTITHGASE